MLKVPHFSGFNPSYSMPEPSKQERYSDIDLLSSIHGDNIEINCCFDNKRKRNLLKCLGEKLYSFSHLLPLIPECTDITALAKALNHLINGIGSHVITDPDAYKKKYEAQYEFALNKTPHFLGDFPLWLGQREHFDISKVDSPKISNDALEFYVEIQNTPYKITCRWPVKTDPPELKQEILPPLQEDLF